MDVYDFVFLVFCVLVVVAIYYSDKHCGDKLVSEPVQPTAPAKPSGLITVGETVDYRKGRKALRYPWKTELAKATVLGFRTTRKHRIMVVLANGASVFARPEADVLAVN